MIKTYLTADTSKKQPKEVWANTNAHKSWKWLSWRKVKSPLSLKLGGVNGWLPPMDFIYDSHHGSPAGRSSRYVYSLFRQSDSSLNTSFLRGWFLKGDGKVRFNTTLTHESICRCLMVLHTKSLYLGLDFALGQGPRLGIEHPSTSASAPSSLSL